MKRKELELKKFNIFQDFVIETNSIYLNYLTIENKKLKSDNSLYDNTLHFQSCILSLYACFQKYLCKMFRVQLQQNPMFYFASCNIKFSELNDKLFNKNNIVNKLIEQRINNFTYGISNLQTLCKALNIDKIGSFNDLKNDYEEFCFRRNIYAHGIDYITTEYLEASKRLSNKWLSNNQLIETDEYVMFSINTISKMFFQIYFELNIANKDKITLESLIILEQVIFKYFYKYKNWNVASYVYGRLKNINMIIKQSNVMIWKQMFVVNYLYCQKQLGYDISQTISKLNFEFETKKFEIARCALLDDFSSIYTKFIELQKSKVKNKLKIKKQDLKEWPIFEEFRKNELYLKLIEDESFI